VSLVDTLWKRALEAVSDEEKHAEWVSKGYDEALAGARKNLPQGDSEEAKIAREVGEKALDKLVEHKGSFVELGKHGLRACLVELATGQYEDAARRAALTRLREEASWGDVNAAILIAAKEGNERKRQLDTAREQVLEVLKDIGIALAKAALPLILSVI
jgi:hypothetical protein